MRLGIFAKTFGRLSMPETLDAVADAGFTTMQFNMSLTGGSSMPDEIPAGEAAAVEEECSRRGLDMAAVSGTYNMAHPDPAFRAEGLRRIGEIIAAARPLGTSCVTLCTGSRDAGDMWRWHRDNATPEAWSDMRAGVEAALIVAEQHGVTLAFEPEHNNVVDDAAAGRRLLSELDSPNLKAIIDPANLFPGGGLAHQSDTLREAFELLGDELVLAHAKDVGADGTIVAAGHGDLDYELYLTLLRALDRDVPLILHGLAEAEVPSSRDFVQAQAEIARRPSRRHIVMKSAVETVSRVPVSGSL
jgi:sugar phosphate isomerase/epimerase